MNYYEMLGMNKEPFSTSPDPHFFYASKEHKAALMKAIIEVRLKRGLSVIMGNVGMGKTTLCRKLLQMFRERENIDIYMILDPDYRTEKLFFGALIKTFSIEITKSRPNTLDYKEALKNFLFKKAVEQGRTVVLLIDEAQKMTLSSLEILRMLLNYETNEYKLLQLLLVGQTELRVQLKQMRNFVDRISFKCVLNPISDLNELRELINFRVEKAGYAGEEKLFDPGAIREIYQYTQGYPRRLAMLCHNALRELVICEQKIVTSEIIRETIAQEVLI